jgi:hypothetical protein
VAIRITSVYEQGVCQWELRGVPEIYRIETIAPEEDGGGVVRRTFVRVDSLEAAMERARRVFTRARVPQAAGPKVEAVRVLDGAGYEVFSLSSRD